MSLENLAACAYTVRCDINKGSNHKTGEEQAGLFLLVSL
jgi:hypothetical protein